MGKIFKIIENLGQIFPTFLSSIDRNTKKDYSTILYLLC